MSIPFSISANNPVQSEAQLNAKSSVLPGFDATYGVYNSFTGADIQAHILIPSQETAGSSTNDISQTAPILAVLGNIQTISYSTFREVNPVRSLGQIYPDSYTRGPRTIAGTIVWTVLDQYVLAQALQNSFSDSANDYGSMLIDQIPPFYITITMSNEYGDVASMAIKGIRMVNEGSVYSIDDLITEQTNTFVAEDIEVLHKGAPFLNSNSAQSVKTGSSVLMSIQPGQYINTGSEG